VRVLLDTHAFLWFSSDDPALSAGARARIEDVRNEKFLSVASIWEMAIKISLGKLELTGDLADLVTTAAERNGIALMDVRKEHALGVEALPLHHRDPFDRLLIAQALAERVAIVGRDPIFDAYPVRRIW
jgi:PIN domain nuclease of toxin-antitoxin system